MPDEWTPIPDERLRLIFVCCHPAVAQRLIRAKRKIAEARRRDEARIAYDAALSLVATSAERLWLERQRAALAE